MYTNAKLKSNGEEPDLETTAAAAAMLKKRNIEAATAGDVDMDGEPVAAVTAASKVGRTGNPLGRFLNGR